MNLNDRLRSSISWLACSKVVVQGISLLSTLTVARLLTPDNYGVMALSAFWTSSLLVVSELGAGAAVIQFQNLKKQELNILFGFTTSLSLLGYLVLFLLAPFIGDWFASEQLSSVLRVAGMALPIATLRVVPEGLLRKELRFDLIAKTNIMSSSLSIPVALMCAFSGAGVWALVASSLVGALAQTLLIFHFEQWRPSTAMKSERWDRLMRFCLQSFGGRICWAVYQQLDVLILGKFEGAVSVGIYTMALQLITFPVEKVFSIVNEIAYPAMAHLQDDVAQLRSSFAQSLRILTAVACPLYIGLAFVAEDLIQIILTDKWSDSAGVLKLLVPYGLFTALAVLPAPILLSRYRADLVFRYTFAQLLIMPLAFWIGARQAGAIGVAMAWVVVYPFSLSWLFIQVFREVQITWYDAWGVVKPAMSAAACMGAALMALKIGLAYGGVSQAAVTLVITVVTGAVTYMCGLWVYGRDLLIEMLAMSTSLVRRNAPAKEKLPARD